MADRYKFGDVFPDMRIGEKLRFVIDDVTITRVVLTEQKTRLDIYMESTHLIGAEFISSLEKMIRDYLFGRRAKECVKIHERYILSDQYDTENLMEKYKDSFLYELREIDMILYSFFDMSFIRTEGNDIYLEYPESKVFDKYCDKMSAYLKSVFSEKFGMTVDVHFSSLSKEEDKERRADEKKKRQEELFGKVDVHETAAEAFAENESFAEKSENVKVENAGENVSEESSHEKASEEKTSEEKASQDNTDDVKKAAQDNKNGKNRRINDPDRKKGYGGRKNPDDPDCFYGRNCEGDCISISEIEDNMGVVCIRGEIIALEERELRTGKRLITADVTDYTDSVSIKLFVAADDIDVIREYIKVGGFYKIKGNPAFDTYQHEINFSSVYGMKTIPSFKESRQDKAEKKRVELSLNTVMSEMDSVVSIEKVIKRAKSWGMKALAITDNGAVQGFPIALHCLDKNDDFKIIYGLKGYLVDDLKDLVYDSDDRSLDTEYVVFDIETTGFSPVKCKIIEIGAVRIDSKGNEIGRFSEFVNPEEPIPYEITKLTSIDDSMVKDAPTIETILPKFREFCKDAVIVAHNASFDTSFIKHWSKVVGIPYDYPALDTMTLAHIFLPELGRYNLDRLCKYFKVVNAHHHRACDDADVTAKIFIKLYDMARERGMNTLADMNELGRTSVDVIKKARTHEGVLLCKNDTGRVNLYRLISESNITYFNRFPRIPMSLIEKYREGLLIGSGSNKGQLFELLSEGRSEEEIARIVQFFDYLEVQPVSNYRYLIADEKSSIKSEKDLEDIVKRIIELGDEFKKPVVATGDVHFLDPDDAIYRTIIMEGKDLKGAEPQPPLYFRTTDEMLEEFRFLGDEKAQEIVVDNTCRISDLIENISPVRPDNCPPVIENSDVTLREICYQKMHEIYGPEVPALITERLDKELDSIINHGYSVMYIIAQKLVWKSNDDGYLVGSRGSVGSSFAATMAGITEVNPLPPHYICPKCYYTDFDSELVQGFSGMSGCDMPDRVCPVCGEKLNKEGHDIPFETFLGFSGNKEPDIDLNFSGEYQPRAHAYIEEIFGKGKAFRAGTIGTLAEKTAFGYVKKYCEKRNIIKRHAEMNRLAAGCTGVKRTTGQHPGGMIVLPQTEEIYSFTPIQKPANDMDTSIITTHFEYHSIQHNLLKFDILGHDDPTMIRRLEDLTGFKATEVPLDDKKVMGLFHGTAPLAIEPSDIEGIPLGCLGVPEFGTEFAMQMVIDAKPESFSDLVRISGLSHGTDVWLGNAQTLIEEGKCKLSSAICCRDDIMIYLIHMGLEKSTAFNIMENVRKGNVAKGKCKDWPEWEKIMLEHGVPDWYAWSCNKIKYMFPKAHAVAYVMMAWRVAYYKIYYPLEYYTAFFSIRATDFSYELMCFGKDKVIDEIRQLRARDKNSLSAKEQGTLRDLKIVLEMYARGFEFLPIDIYKAYPDRFRIIDGKIMPSLIAIDGMGEKAARTLAEEAGKSRFLSRDEIKTRGKVSQTILDKMTDFGILGDIPDTAQFTFDFE